MQWHWWQRGVIYHVYPRSFADASGDGVGDLPGITARLGHLRRLGVDALWLSPVYPSPMADFGYDVTDHTDVDPLFGTLADLDALIAAAHGLGLRVLLDYVPNHTSDRHPWFQEARAARDAPRRDFYLWRDPAPDGGPPNNWRSVFGGSAWEHDPAMGQSYYHAYLREQPDLNWRSPEVREAMLGVLRFWVTRGVDGFRVDALRQLVKDAEWRDNPPNPHAGPGATPYEQLLPLHSTDQPEVHDAVRAMRAVLEEDGRRDRLLVGELYLPLERLVAYYPGVDLPANFHLIATPWEAEAVGALVERYERLLPSGAWPNWVLGNHDRARVASRVGTAQARVAAMLLLTLRGTPTLYYGDELGLPDAEVPPDRVQDPFARNLPGLAVGRDPCRSPMPWTRGPNAGFCPPGVEPWLPLVPDAASLSVAAQSEDPGSMLALHERLLALRRTEPALAVGAFAVHHAEDGVLAYVREHAGRRLAVALNLGPEPRPAGLDELDARVVLSTRPGGEGRRLGALAGDEGVVASCAR